MQAIIRFIIHRKYKFIIGTGFLILYLYFYHRIYPGVNPFTSLFLSLLITFLLLEGTWRKVLVKFLFATFLILTSSLAYQSQENFFVAVTSGIALSFLVVDIVYHVIVKSIRKRKA